MTEVHMGSPKGYPILRETDVENFSTTVLKFKSLKETSSLLGRQYGKGGTLHTRSGDPRGWYFQKLEIVPWVWLKAAFVGKVGN